VGPPLLHLRPVVLLHLAEAPPSSGRAGLFSCATIPRMANRIALIAILAIALGLGSLHVFIDYEIDCGGLDRASCERGWQIVQERFGTEQILPITAVTVIGATPDDPLCGSWWVYRLGIGGLLYSCL
jgi:hypothetical protein